MGHVQFKKRHIQLISGHNILKRHTVLPTVCPKGTLISFSRWIPVYFIDVLLQPASSTNSLRVRSTIFSFVANTTRRFRRSVKKVRSRHVSLVIFASYVRDIEINQNHHERNCVGLMNTRNYFTRQIVLSLYI